MTEINPLMYIWRQGRRVPRNIYVQVGREPDNKKDYPLMMVESAELAEHIVNVHNTRIMTAVQTSQYEDPLEIEVASLASKYPKSDWLSPRKKGESDAFLIWRWLEEAHERIDELKEDVRTLGSI